MIEQDLSVPVIAIDGGAGVGKGTASVALAEALGFHVLDSGVLYRALGLVCHKRRLADVREIAAAGRSLDVRFVNGRVHLEGQDQTDAIRSSGCSRLASQVSQLQEARDALLDFQLRCRRAPGLVADGRDMGMVFETPYRYFLEATLEAQAERRTNQFRRDGKAADYDTILVELQTRDEADKTRAVRPLKPHPEAMIIDTTAMDPREVFQIILEDYKNRSAA